MTQKNRIQRKGMKKRKLALALAACLSVPSANLLALGTGEINVESALNQPLSAKIDLVSVSDADLETLSVSLASDVAFERMGIERSALLNDIVFEIVTAEGATPYIKVHSKTPIREPFVDFIVAISWENGQMLREYTLLLDPPVFADDLVAAAPVVQATATPAQIERQAAVPAAPQEPPASAARVMDVPVGSFGPTKRTDTLWSIAREMRPDPAISPPQMMMALLRENPEAFMNGNVNSLKAGYVLNAPSLELIQSLSKAEAAAETNRQYQTWQASRRGEVVRPSMPTQVKSERPVPSNDVTANEARLQLVSPDENTQGTGVGSGGASDSQLAIALESTEVARQENAELRERVAELERQLQSVQRLLTLKDNDLGAMQAGAAEESAAVQAEQATAAVVVAEPEAAAPAAVAQPAPAKPKPKPVVQPEPLPEPSLLDTILQDVRLLALAVGAPLLLLGGAYFMRRRKQQALEEESFDAESPMAEAGAKAVAPAAAAAAVTEAEAGTKPEEAEGLGETVASEPTPDMGYGVDTGVIQDESEIDPVAEADVYLAYRRYEQAEGLLKDAIRNDPDRQELKLKLLEIFYATKNADAFEAQAESLYASLGGQEEGLWEQAATMGRELSPGHPLFSDGSEAAESESAPADVDEAPAAVEEEAVAATESDDVDLGDDLLSDADLAGSLDLSLDGLGELDMDAAAADVSAAAALAGDDLDLDSLGDLETAGDTELGDLGDLSDLGGDELDLGDLDAGDTKAKDDKAKFDTDSTEELAEGVDAELGDLGSMEDLTGADDAATASVTEPEGLDDLGEFDLGATDEASALDELSGLGDESDALSDGLEATPEVDLDAELADFDLGDLADDVAETDLSGDLADDAVLTLDESAPALESGDDELDLSKLDSAESTAELSDELSESVEDLSSDMSALDDSLAESADEALSNTLDLDADVADASDTAFDLSGMDDFEQQMKELESSLASDEPLELDALNAETADTELSDVLSGDESLFANADDAVASKLDLAKAYIDMGDEEGARAMLNEVSQEGDETQKQEAEQLMQQLG